MAGEMAGGAPPQQGAQGQEVMKEVGATLLSQADSLKQFAAQVMQVGAPESVAAKIDQAATLIQQAMGEMGVGAQQGAAPAEGASPDTAGVAGAQPAQGF